MIASPWCQIPIFDHQISLKCHNSAQNATEMALVWLDVLLFLTYKHNIMIAHQGAKSPFLIPKFAKFTIIQQRVIRRIPLICYINRENSFITSYSDIKLAHYSEKSDLENSTDILHQSGECCALRIDHLAKYLSQSRHRLLE